MACCLNQSHVGSCRSVITSKYEIITEENSREEECHVPRGRVSLILRSFVYVRTGIAIDSEFDCILLTVVIFIRFYRPAWPLVIASLA